MSTPLASAQSSESPTRESVAGRLSRAGVEITRSREFGALLDQVVVSATNFVTNVLVANYCLPRDFGIFYLAISLLYFMRGIQEQLVSAPYTIFWHRRDPANSAVYTGSTLVHQILLSAATFISLVLLVALLGRHPASSDLVAALRVLLVVLPCFLFREYIRKLLFAHFEFRAAVLLDVIVAALQLGTIAALVWAEKISVTSVFLCIAAACGVAAAFWYGRYRMPIALDRYAVRQDWRDNWSFGRWALLTHVIGCSTPYLMPWFIKFLRDESITAMYASCQTLVGLGNMLLTGVSNYLHPKSAHAYTLGGTSQLWRVLIQAAALFAITLGPFCALLGLTGDAIPQYVFGDEYAGLGKPLFYLAAALLATGLGMTAGNGLWALAKPSWNMTADLACLVCSFGLGYAWIPQGGATGAAAAVMVGAAAAAAMRWLILVWLLERAGAGEQRGWQRSGKR